MSASLESVDSPEAQGRVRQVWFLRFRFALASVGLAVVVVADFFAGWTLPVWTLASLFALSLLSNVLLYLYAQSGARMTDGLIFLAIGFDLLILTLALGLSGGASNPFSSVYLIYIPIGALLLSPRFTWILVVLAVGAYTFLFWPDLDSGHAGHQSMQTHLVGMWVAFIVVGPMVAYAVSRLRAAVESAEEALMQTRARQERAEKLAALATLSAGAAHELSTPLGTIAIAAKELEQNQDDPRVTEDARLIQQEIQRCSGILSQLAVDVGTGIGEAVQSVRVSELVEATAEEFPPVQILADEAVLGRRVEVPRRLMLQALHGIMKNARQASTPDDEIQIRVMDRPGSDLLALEIRDQGSGMNSHVLRHVGEPFFTQKPAGEGMGLGVFFARSVVEQMNGRIEFVSREGEGTRVHIGLPWSSQK
jgi:two-component system sensor histidine kinase RegB